jgi:WD40 repeat protein
MHTRSDRIQTLSYSPKDKYLATGCVDGGLDIYDIKNGYQNIRFKNNSKIK